MSFRTDGFEADNLIEILRPELDRFTVTFGLYFESSPGAYPSAKFRFSHPIDGHCLVQLTDLGKDQVRISVSWLIVDRSRMQQSTSSISWVVDGIRKETIFNSLREALIVAIRDRPDAWQKVTDFSREWGPVAPIFPKYPELTKENLDSLLPKM